MKRMRCTSQHSRFQKETRRNLNVYTKSGSKNKSNLRWGENTHSKKIFIRITKQANLVKSFYNRHLSNADTGDVYLLQSMWMERLCYHACRTFFFPQTHCKTTGKKTTKSSDDTKSGVANFRCIPATQSFHYSIKFGYLSASLRHAIPALWPRR